MHYLYILFYTFSLTKPDLIATTKLLGGEGWSPPPPSGDALWEFECEQS